MANQILINIRGRCLPQLAPGGTSPHVGLVLDAVKETLTKRLRKKGFDVEWSQQPGPQDLWVTITQIDPGNQFLRWLIPFLSPAIVSIQGQLNPPNSAPPVPFQIEQKAHFGLLGGTGQGMLKQCATEAAKRIGKIVVKSMK